MESKRAVLVLVDISGYTQFLKLHAMSMIHAEEIITQLLEAVIDKSEHPLTLNNLEGDPAFLYALTGEDESVIAQAALERDHLKLRSLVQDVTRKKVDWSNTQRPSTSDTRLLVFSAALP